MLDNDFIINYFFFFVSIFRKIIFQFSDFLFSFLKIYFREEISLFHKLYCNLRMAERKLIVAAELKVASTLRNGISTKLHFYEQRVGFFLCNL